MRLLVCSVLPALTPLLFVSSCGLLSSECVDCIGPPSPINNAGTPSVTIVDAPAGALWWVPLTAGDALSVSDGSSPQPLEIVVTTATSRALRVPATLAPGTTGNVGTFPVSVAEPFGAEGQVPVLAAESASITACNSACSTLFDPQARPTSFEVPGALVRDIENPSDVALDIWPGEVEVDDAAPRIADTVAIEGGFDQRFFISFGANELRIPIDPGRYTFRLRQLSTGRVSEATSVLIE